MVNEKEIYLILENIPDPEIPNLNIVEMGMISKIEVTENEIVIFLRPTYLGCPALKIIEEDILSSFKNRKVKVEVSNSPIWSTDYFTTQTKEKLCQCQIAPPQNENRKIICPRCKSSDTIIKSNFGSTPCKALWWCNNCIEPLNILNDIKILSERFTCSLNTIAFGDYSESGMRTRFLFL